MRDYTREPPFNHIDLTSSGLTFPRILARNITISISHFSWAGRKIEQGDRSADPMRTLFSPTGTPPRNGAPPHLPRILCWGKLAPRHFALLRAAPFRVAVRCLRNVSLASHKIFSPCTYLVLPSAIAENRLVSSHPLEEVTLPRWHQTMGIMKMEGRTR